MTKKIFLVLFFINAFLFLSAQKISDTDLSFIQSQEDKLKVLLKSAIVSNDVIDRLKDDSSYIRTFIQALKIKNSFYYPFDSVRGMAVTYSPDSVFRVMTWAIKISDNYFRKQGAIQMNTKNGELKLIPLFDYSTFTTRPFDTVRTNKNWIGAVYYEIIDKLFNGKKYYTLIGRDENTLLSTKKWIEVMYFDNNQQPVFGGNFFYNPDVSIAMKNAARYFVEYNKDASVTVKYFPEKEMIIMDKLISASNQPDMPSTFVPSGDYCGFVWKYGRWNFIPLLQEDINTNKPVDVLYGNAPREKPMFDKDGNIDEKKLKEYSDKNRERENEN